MTEKIYPLDVSQRDQFKWVERPECRAVTRALNTARAGSARFVGGCVRNTLIGAPISDIDIATSLPPEESRTALTAAGLKAIPTGIEHGTITAVHEGVGVEVTSLRADVSTDGRRATVAFTEDWDQDWRRRDFTMNAIYLTPDFNVYDPAQGVADARAGRVRFIGDPAGRIREDYLRILRFFRFNAWYGGKEFDRAGLQACADLAPGMTVLSAERVGAEVMKLLAAPRPTGALRLMAEAGVLEQVWNEDSPRLDLVERVQSAARETVEPILRLAALWPEAGAALDRRLRLPKQTGTLRRNALETARAFGPLGDQKAERALLYRCDTNTYRRGAWLAWAASGRPAKMRCGGRGSISRTIGRRRSFLCQAKTR